MLHHRTDPTQPHGGSRLSRKELVEVERVVDVRLVLVHRGPVGWLRHTEPPRQFLEALAVFRDVDRVGARPEDRNACRLEALGQLERRTFVELLSRAE